MTDSQYDFRKATELCHSYKWVFGTKMTDIFVQNVWTNRNFDQQFQFVSLQALDFNDFRSILSGEIKSSWQHELKLLLTLMDSCTFRSHSKHKHQVELPKRLQVGMSLKKKHEISRLSSLVQKACQYHKCRLVADIGCGLGYLGQSLIDLCDLDVIGFELKEENCQNARKPTKLSENESVIQQLSVDFSEECSVNLQNAINSMNTMVNPSKTVHTNITSSEDTSVSQHKQFCMVGLHCCGDLTPAMLHQFTTIPMCKSLVCVGCCYHRLSLAEKDGQSKSTFSHFPLSNELKDVFQNFEYKQTFNQLAMRQACQETVSRWVHKTDEEFEEHTKHVIYRAVFEYCCQNYEFNLSKHHKKLVHSKDFLTFDTYTKEIIERVKGLSTEEAERFKEKMMESYNLCQPFFPHVRWYSVLQVLMQGVLESIILHDRLKYLHENGIEAELVSVFNDSISPRNIAIVAHKTS